jgi:hypothetical protein
MVSAVLAEYGFVTIRMSSDWSGADFIAQHRDGKFLKVQLKSRLTFSKKYFGTDKELYICFRDAKRWYLYPHDEMLQRNLDRKYIGKEFWDTHGDYSNPKPSKGQRQLLDPYQLKSGHALSL